MEKTRHLVELPTPDGWVWNYYAPGVQIEPRFLGYTFGKGVYQEELPVPRTPRATLSREDLERLYCVERLTLAEISMQTGVPTTTLTRWRVLWGLPTVARADSFVGRRFGRWTVLAETPGGRRGIPTTCHSRCDCGTLRDIPYGNLQQGVTQSCGCLFSIPEGQAGLNKLIDGYKRSAAERNLEYTLTHDHVATLTKQPCFYCGVEPRQVRQERSVRSRYVYNGIDRFDNSRGYVATNVVAGCWQCNRTKQGHSGVDFLAWVARVHAPEEGAVKGSPWEPQFREVGNGYRSKARYRGLSFTLTPEQMMGLLQAACAYCDAPPGNGQPGALYSGIDRLDNTQGYHRENCASACQRCNFAKLDLSVDAFLGWARRIQHHATAISSR